MFCIFNIQCFMSSSEKIGITANIWVGLLTKQQKCTSKSSSSSYQQLNKETEAFQEMLRGSGRAEFCSEQRLVLTTQTLPQKIEILQKSNAVLWKLNQGPHKDMMQLSKNASNTWHDLFKPLGEPRPITDNHTWSSRTSLARSHNRKMRLRRRSIRFCKNEIA